MSTVFKAENYIESGMSLGIFKSSCDKAEPTHTHDFAEIIYILDGCAVETVNGKGVELTRGSMLFINRESTHEFTPKDKFTYYNICFMPEIIAERIINRDNAFDLLSLTAVDELRRAESSVGNMTFDGEERVIIESILADMLAEYGGMNPERCAVLESYMTIIVSKILRKLEPTETKKSETDLLWKDILAFIDSNLGERLTLSALAKQCFYNPSYFSRSFKERFGITLVEYITRSRAEAAAKMLAETDLSTSEIAARCGFGEKSALYRAFSKRYGMTPREWRESKR
ncbi:MAG: helix-turn-helix domain-containing protein [Clostridia bacterium]|nr:helix-turn-helix domain-containing protein [Clostridia bacterium]